MIQRILRTVRRMVSFVLWLLHPRLPLRIVAPTVRRRATRKHADPKLMADARRNMAHVVGLSPDDDAVASLAESYLTFWTWADELRWHPGLLTRQQVEGLQHLVAAKKSGRGVLLSFVHHSHFAGAFASLAHVGHPVHVLAAGGAVRDGGPQMRQHLRVVGTGGKVVAADSGMAGIIGLLEQRHVVAAAIDVPGSSVTRFAGQQVRCSSGLVRAAQRTGAPIVPIATEWQADGTPRLVLGEPRTTTEEDDVAQVLQSLVDWHEPYIVARPDAAYLPLVCWRPIDD